VTGRQARKTNGTVTSIIPSNITRRAAQKATIIAAIEMKSVESLLSTS